MLHKCSIDCIWKGLQLVNDLQGHSRSLPLLPFDRPHTISIPLSIYLYLATFFQILTLICQKLRHHVTLTTPTWETVCHHKTKGAYTHTRVRVPARIRVRWSGLPETRTRVTRTGVAFTFTNTSPGLLANSSPSLLSTIRQCRSWSAWSDLR